MTTELPIYYPECAIVPALPLRPGNPAFPLQKHRLDHDFTSGYGGTCANRVESTTSKTTGSWKLPRRSVMRLLDANQFSTWDNGGTYDVRGDLDLDGDVDTTDYNTSNGNTGTTLGRGVLSDDPDTVGNRNGYAGYIFDDKFGFETYHVRSRWYNASLVRWITHDPLEYVDGLIFTLRLITLVSLVLLWSGCRDSSTVYSPVNKSSQTVSYKVSGIYPNLIYGDMRPGTGTMPLREVTVHLTEPVYVEDEIVVRWKAEGETKWELTTFSRERMNIPRRVNSGRISFIYTEDGYWDIILSR